MNELTIVDKTVDELRRMVEKNLEIQAEVLPVYESISKKILSIVNKEEELPHWEAKDLLKLLDLSNKAQLAPIEQLTKLVQSITALHERSALQEKVNQISDVVKELEDAKSSKAKKSIIDSEDIEVDYQDVEDDLTFRGK